MRLDDAIFEEVVMALGASETQEGELRRRRGSRYFVDTLLTIQPLGAARPVCRQARLLDVSAYGLCLIDTLATSSGDRFVASLPRLGGANIEVICTVRQSRLSMSGGFRIGAEFTSEEESGTRLVSGVNGITSSGNAPAPMADAPRELRIAAQIHDLVNQSGQVGFPAEVRQASGKEIVLLTQKALAVGDKFVLEFIQGKRRTQRWLCLVMHVAVREQGKYRVRSKILSPEKSPDSGGGMGGWFRRLF